MKRAYGEQEVGVVVEEARRHVAVEPSFGVSPPSPLLVQRPHFSRPLTFTVEEPQRLADRSKKDYFTNRAHRINEIIAWLQATYQINNLGSLPKEEVYEDYMRLCSQADKEPLSKAMMGKILHHLFYRIGLYIVILMVMSMACRAFPNIQCNRLGPRGQTKHCYKGLQRILPEPHAFKARHPYAPPPPELLARGSTSSSAAVHQLTAVQAQGLLPPLQSIPAVRPRQVLYDVAPPQQQPVRKRPRQEAAAPAPELPLSAAASKSAAVPFFGGQENGSDEGDHEESDYEQLEATPEHSSEGNQTSDWEGSDGGDGSLGAIGLGLAGGYLDLMREGPSAIGGCPRPSFPPAGVSDSLLQFLRASPVKMTTTAASGQSSRSSSSSGSPGCAAWPACGSACSDCAALPQFNPPPYISLLNVHPLQQQHYASASSSSAPTMAVTTLPPFGQSRGHCRPFHFRPVNFERQ